MSSFVKAEVVGGEWDGYVVGVEKVSLVSDAVWDEVVVLVIVGNVEQVVNLRALSKELINRIVEGVGAVEESDMGAVREVVVGVVDPVPQVEEYAVAVRRGSQVGLLVRGGASVSLCRQGKLGKLVDSEDELQVVVGELQDSDVLLLASSDLFARVAYAKLKTWFVQAMGPDTEEVSRGLEEVAEKMAVEANRGQGRKAWGGVVVGLARESESEVAVTDQVKKRGGLVWWRNMFASKRIGGVYLRRKGVFSRRKRLGLMVVAVIVLALGASLVFGWRRRIEAEKQVRLAEIVEPVEQNLVEAQGRMAIDRLEARRLVEEAGVRVEEALGQFGEETKEREQLEELAAKVEEVGLKVAGVEKVELDLFLDLSLVSEGFFGESMARVEDWVVVLDPSGGLLMKIGGVNKQAQVVAGDDELAGASLVGGGTDKALVVVSGRVLVVDPNSDENDEGPEDEWQEVVGAASFGTNVYVLDKGEGEIWRYRAVEGDDWVRQRWLAPGISPDFSQTVDMAIDGDVWVLDGDGSVRRYSRGASTGFSVSGFGEAVEACCIEVNEGVFVLDKAKERVIEYSDEGVFLKQMVWESVGLISDMAVVEGKVLLLSGSKVYELGR